MTSHKKNLTHICIGLGFTFLCQLSNALSPIPPSGTTPTKRTIEFDWMSVSTWDKMHAEDAVVAQYDQVDVLFVGDSLPQRHPHAIRFTATPPGVPEGSRASRGGAAPRGLALGPGPCREPRQRTRRPAGQSRLRDIAARLTRPCIPVSGREPGPHWALGGSAAAGALARLHHHVTWVPPRVQASQ